MTGSPLLNLARVLDRTWAEGPGVRFCLWVQGCTRACPGCCNATMQPLVARGIVSPDEVCARVADAKSAYGIEGVTFLGGEPFLQADGLAQVAETARALGLSVMVFTGFTLNECRSLPCGVRLLAATDVLVDGPYEKDLPETCRNWVGSRNQKFHYLTARYDPSIETDGRYRHVVELKMEGSSWLMNGSPMIVDSCAHKKLEL